MMLHRRGWQLTPSIDWANAQRGENHVEECRKEHFDFLGYAVGPYQPSCSAALSGQSLARKGRAFRRAGLTAKARAERQWPCHECPGRIEPLWLPSASSIKMATWSHVWTAPGWQELFSREQQVV